MANALVLETLSLKELGALGSSVRLKYWQHLRKGDLLERLAALNRDFTQEDLDAASVALARKQAARAARVKNAQDANVRDLLSESSIQTIKQDDASCDSANTPSESVEAVKSRSCDAQKSVRAIDVESDDVSVPVDIRTKDSSDSKGTSKNKKTSRRFESSSSVVERKETQVEPSCVNREQPASENVLSETCDARSSSEKVASIAEKVVPLLAERLARRLAECLTKELALEKDSGAQGVVGAPSQNDEEVAAKLLDTISPSSTSDAPNDSDKAESPQTGKEVVKETLKIEEPPRADESNRRLDEETEDDVLIETILPETNVSQRSKRPAGGTPSLKDKLRLKKFIGSPYDKVDRLMLMVCDPYWIRACWEVTEQLVERVRSAMSRHWHTSDPILRLYRVDPTTTRREFVKDVEISGGVSNWYVPVENPPSSFVVELGYKSRDGQFFTLLSSNAVQTPKQFVRDSNGRPSTESFNAPFNFQTGSYDRWTQKARHTQAERRSSLDEGSDKTFAPSESAVGTSLSTNEGFIAPSTFLFQADAEVLFTGRVSNGATVKVREESVCQAPDGSFSIRFSLPERRHVFPIVATSLDENETQTIIVAIERNTKTLDPVYKEDDEE